MANNFTALGNFQTGYLDRVIGRGGILSTAKRIDKMLSLQAVHNSRQGHSVNLGAGSIVYARFRNELYLLIEKKGKVGQQEKELVKRLLQQIEMHVYSNLSDEVSNQVIKEFEKNL